MKKKRLKLWLGIAIGLIALWVLIRYSGCLNKGSNNRVSIETVEEKSLVETVDASGKIFPESEIRIKADVSGEIVALPVAEGDSVHKGQLLMKIDPAIYLTEVNQSEAQMAQANAGLANSRELVAQAKAQYERAKAEYERNQQLFQDKVISASEFEQFKSDYLATKAGFQAAQANASGSNFNLESSKALLSQARENLGRTIIKSPADGVISQLLVKNGERVVGTQQMDGSQIMTIADLGRMEVRVDINEADITKIHVGDTAKIDVDAYRDKTFVGMVTKISVSSAVLNQSIDGRQDNSSDQVTNYTVHVLIIRDSVYQALTRGIRGETFPFKPGMSAAVQIQTRKGDHQTVVPINAVTMREIQGKTAQTVVFVYDKKKRKVRARPVTTGLQDNEFIEIKSGLKKSEKVVTAPYSAIARELKDGDEVEVVDRETLYSGEGQ